MKPRILPLPILFMAVVLTVPSLVEAAVVTRGPYLQLQAPTSTSIVWATDVACASEVEWGLTTGYGNVQSSPVSETRHEIAITGLAADTLYHYRVRLAGTPLTGDATFRTAPSSSATSVSFAVQGDSRSAPTTCQAIFNAMLPETASGFCISMGDLPGRGEDCCVDYWQSHFFTPAADYVKNICLYPCIGNHELYNENSQYVYPTRYLDAWSLPATGSGSELYYSFDKGNAHFASLDVFWSSYAAGSDQYNWLVGDLAGSSKPWKIVFMHDGPYISRSGAAGGNSTIRSTLVPVFESHDVDLVINGHYHDYQRNIVNGVHYMIQGCGGAPLNALVDDSQSYVQAFASEFCYTRLDIQGSRLLGWTKKTNGTVLDGFQIDKPPVAMPWQDTFPAGEAQLNWIAPWNFSTQCGLIARAGTPSGDGYCFQVADTSGNQFAYPMLANESITDVSIEAQVYYDAATSVMNRYGIGVRGRQFFDSAKRSYYALVFVRNDSLGSNGHALLLYRAAGADTVLASWTYPDTSGWHKMKLSVAGSELSVWIDGVLKTTTPITHASLSRGRPFVYNYRATGGAKTLADDVVIGQAAPSSFEEVDAGVTYAQYQVAGPNKAHVVAIDRLRSQYKLELGWAQKKRNYSSRQTVSTIAGLYDNAPNHDVLAAVNASFFGTNPAITGAAASGGEMLEQPIGNYETFLFGPSRLPAIHENIAHVNGTLTFADGTTTTLHSYNKSAATDTVTAYTPQWAPTTGTTVEGIEVVLSGVSYPMRGNKVVSGVVTAIRTGPDSKNNPIPAGGMVLSAVGTPVATLAGKVAPGDRLQMRFATNTTACNNADMSVTGIGWILKDGVANTDNWTQYTYDSERHPRTVLAWNNATLFLFVCDGRCNGIVGMTFQEMADFLTGTLGATDAINLDGGGSSTMWVNGAVRNLPSDSCGTERTVANAVLLVKQDTATTFPFTDPFAVAGRLPGWDDKFTYSPVTAFSPTSPGGDGYVLRVTDTAGGVETIRRGDFGDTDYVVQADIFCEYRPSLAANGYERYALFARDNGIGGLGLTGTYGPGNCYALTYDSDTGRIRAGKYVNGVLTDFRESSPLYAASTAWRRFRLECLGSSIRYLVDGTVIADVSDTSFGNGYFGIGYHEFFSTNSNILGTRADNFLAEQSGSPPGKAADPEPAHLATGVSRDAHLNWTVGSGATAHRVHFGTITPPVFRGEQAAASYDPGPLSLGTTYYWRIDEVSDHGITTGDEWQFVTLRYRGDFDNDGDVDQSDFGLLQQCLAGPQAAVPTGCESCDLDGSQHVDQGDVALFLPCMGGPALPPACE